LRGQHIDVDFRYVIGDSNVAGNCWLWLLELAPFSDSFQSTFTFWFSFDFVNQNLLPVWICVFGSLLVSRVVFVFILIFKLVKVFTFEEVVPSFIADFFHVKSIGNWFFLVPWKSDRKRTQIPISWFRHTSWTCPCANAIGDQLLFVFKFLELGKILIIILNLTRNAFVSERGKSCFRSFFDLLSPYHAPKGLQRSILRLQRTCVSWPQGAVSLPPYLYGRGLGFGVHRLEFVSIKVRRKRFVEELKVLNDLILARYERRTCQRLIQMQIFNFIYQPLLQPHSLVPIFDFVPIVNNMHLIIFKPALYPYLPRLPLDVAHGVHGRQISINFVQGFIHVFDDKVLGICNSSWQGVLALGLF
jgi:hypothetical protein